jgi:hypothetical protein
MRAKLTKRQKELLTETKIENNLAWMTVHMGCFPVNLRAVEKEKDKSKGP